MWSAHCPCYIPKRVWQSPSANSGLPRYCPTQPISVSPPTDPFQSNDLPWHDLLPDMAHDSSSKTLNIHPVPASTPFPSDVAVMCRTSTQMSVTPARCHPLITLTVLMWVCATVVLLVLNVDK